MTLTLERAVQLCEAAEELLPAPAPYAALYTSARERFNGTGAGARASGYGQAPTDPSTGL